MSTGPLGSSATLAGSDMSFPPMPVRLAFGEPHRGLGAGLGYGLPAAIRSTIPASLPSLSLDLDDAVAEVKNGSLLPEPAKPSRKRVRGPGRRTLDPKPGHYVFYYLGVPYEIPVECLIVPCSALYKN